MLKISREPDEDDLVTLRLEGEITGPWVDETNRACERVLARGEHIRMDLRDVTFVDRAGVELLQRLKKGRAVLNHCSPFLKAQLCAKKPDR